MTWIDKEKRLPRAKDGDAQGCVIGWHIYQGCIITGWRNAKQSAFISHWMECPEGPIAIDPLPCACGKARVRIETGVDER